MLCKITKFLFKNDFQSTTVKLEQKETKGTKRSDHVTTEPGEETTDHGLGRRNGTEIGKLWRQWGSSCKSLFYLSSFNVTDIIVITFLVYFRQRDKL